MNFFKRIQLFSLAAGFSLLAGCGIYGFSEKGTVEPDVRTVRVNMIENRASYVNPQLSPNLTERLKQKILNQTKLTNTSGSTAHLEITGYITDYSVSTSGVGAGAPGSRQQAQINRLTVTVTIVRLNQLTNTTQEHNVSRSFEFSASQSLQAAESALLDEMVRNLADEIFNRLFSNW